MVSRRLLEPMNLGQAEDTVSEYQFNSIRAQAEDPSIKHEHLC